MRERPILFSAPMVRALLVGTKTQTRRVVKDTGLYAIDAAGHGAETAARELACLASRCPYGVTGDRLWAREAWRAPAEFDRIKPIELLAPRDGLLGTPVVYEASRHESVQFGKVRPGIFMPRWASRITLEVTSVRVERLQEISEADAVAEGAWLHDGHGTGHTGYRHDSRDGFVWATAKASYMKLWEQINGPGSWAANPWVWVVEFRRLEPAS